MLTCFQGLEAVNVIQSVLLRGGGTVCWKGHRASVFHHLAIHHNVTQVPACQDSWRALPGVREVWISGAFNQEMIATSHDSWCGLVVIVYMLSSRSSILRLKCIPPLLRAIPAPTRSASSAEQRPELTFQSFDRSQEAEQYKCLKCSLDSIPFHLFFPSHKTCGLFSVSARGGLDLCWVAASTADLAVNPFLQLTLCLCSHFGARWALE